MHSFGEIDLEGLDALRREDSIERVQVVEQSRPSVSAAAEYDRTIGSSDWGEKEPSQASRDHSAEQARRDAAREQSQPEPAQQPGPAEHPTDATLQRNAELVEQATEIGVKGVRALTARPDWTEAISPSVSPS